MKLLYHALCDKSAGPDLNNLYIVQDKETGRYFERFIYVMTLDSYSLYPRTELSVQWSALPTAVVPLMSETDIWLREHADSVEGVPNV